MSSSTRQDAQIGEAGLSAAADGAPLAAIQLINSPRLRLGALTIDPPLRRLVHDDGREEFLEPRVMQVLVAFARSPGAILSRDDLIAACWEGRFVSDDSVNRVMSRLRRVSQEIGKDSLRLETITKVGFRLIVAQEPDQANAPSTPTDPTLPAVLPTPTGEGEPEAPPPSEQVVATFAPLRQRNALASARAAFGVRPGAVLAGLVGVVLLAVVAGVLIWRSTPQLHAIPELQLARFDNLGAAGAPGADQALREELVAVFGRSNSLQLFTDGAKSTPGPFSFRLGGSVQQFGPALHFAFTLSRGAPGAVVWSGVIERPVADAASAPRQIAAQVSFTVRCILDGAAGYPGVLPQAAISDYAQFCAEVASSESGQAISRATEDLRKAVAQAPNFATGWAALGYVIGDTFAYPAALWDAGSRKEATEAADRALRLDPANTWGRLAKALLVPLPNYAGRDDGLRLAVQAADTFGDAHAAYARFLLSVGRLKEAAFFAEHGYDLDPNDREAITRLVQAFYMLNRVPEADALLTQANALWGDSDKLTIYKLWAATWDGHYQDALETLHSGRYDEAIRGVGPDTGSPLPIADAGATVFKALDSGTAADRAEAVAAMARLAADRRPIDPFVPVALAALGHDQEALAANERVVKEWSTSLTFILFTPPFANARRSPQFKALADRLGLLSYWRLPGRAPDFCTDPNPPPLCQGLR
jgi:DNA-binding winged helix-turn-helix (wHTH) protein/tetratricopeptide (TPR) repeat protein